MQSGLNIWNGYFVGIADMREQFQKPFCLALSSKEMKSVSECEEKEEHGHAADEEDGGQHAVILEHETCKSADHFSNKIAHDHGETGDIS